MARALVTGHSRGLGAAIALELRSRGMQVLGLARHPGPPGIDSVALDLAETAALSSWLAAGALQRFFAGASAAVLVDNAGSVQPVAPGGRQGAPSIAAAVALNVAAPLLLADAFLAATASIADRRIAHVSSGAARRAYAGWSVYCASKAALDRHAEALALEGHTGLRVESVAPGVLDTAMQAELRGTDAADFPARERFLALHRDGGLVAPADAARRFVDHLLSSRFGERPLSDLRDIA